MAIAETSITCAYIFRIRSNLGPKEGVEKGFGNWKRRSLDKVKALARGGVAPFSTSFFKIESEPLAHSKDSVPQ